MSSSNQKNQKSYFHFLAYEEVVKELRITNRPAWQKKTIHVFFVVFAALWMIVPVVFISAVVINYQINKDDWARQEEVSKTISAECDAKGGDYDLYPSGEGKPQVCRTPINEEEWQNLRERRAYRNALENGDIEAPTIDENCYNARVCQ